jgi:hypothetical protein
MDHQEVCDKLIELEFPEGWAVRNGKIVVWENAEPVPEELTEFVELDAVPKSKAKK